MNLLKKNFVFFFFTTFLINPIFVGATHYFEYDPDLSEAVSFSEISSSPVYQVFKPNNEFISGIDLWVANEESAGYVTFILKNETNNIITSKTVLVPNAPRVFGGHKLHINFNSQYAVNHDKNYYLEIQTSLNDFYLYKSKRVQLLQHNSSDFSEPLIGFVKLGNFIESYTFKYALHEDNESSLPKINNLNTTDITSSNITVNFYANEPVDYSIIENNITGSSTLIDYLNNFKICTLSVKVCSVNFTKTDVASSGYDLSVKDVWGNVFIYTLINNGGVQNIEVTPGELDTTVPIISNLRTISINSSTVAFSWTTNEAASSRVLIRQNNQIKAIGEDQAFELAHYVVIPNLNPDNNYLATVIAEDPATNVSYQILIFGTYNQDTVQNFQNVTPPNNTTPPQNNTPTNNQNQNIPPTNNNNSNNQQTSEQNTNPITPTNNPNSSGSSTINITVTNPNEINVFWPSDNGNSGVTNYRIDIFSGSWKIVKQLVIPGVEKELNNALIKNLQPGSYNISVYKNENDTLKKVSSPITVTIPDSITSKEDLLQSLVLKISGGFSVIIIILLIILKRDILIKILSNLIKK